MQAVVRQSVIVLEGMPGAGKTSLANFLAAQGRRILPEYVVNDGMPPAPGDDANHQSNWERKEELLEIVTDWPVIVDRNFLSSLAYAYSIRSSIRGSRLLEERVGWCRERLMSGLFEHPRIYCLFDCPIELSLSRRHITRSDDHPWTISWVLSELRRFYSAIPEVLGDLHSALMFKNETRVLRFDGEESLASNTRLMQRIIMEAAS